MTSFSLIAAFVTVIIASVFSAVSGILPIILFVFLLVLNCECMAANACEEEQNSMLFMAVICSALVVVLCGVLVSSTVNHFLCAAGLLDPEKIHPVIPFAVMILIIVMYWLLFQRGKQNRLIVQKLGNRLMKSIDSRTYNPRLKRIRRHMIREGTLTERLFDEE
jgi:hypothetical protein